MELKEKYKNETIKMVIIADDFTGALDTGIQFAKSGADTITLVNVDMEAEDIAHMACEVLVINSETRHLEKKDAYRIIYGIVRRCVEGGVPYLYKKTDSVLRGNIGAELKAVLDASGEKILAMVPAYPQIGRNTVEGICYVNEIPIADTLLGKDPFDPVKSSRVADLFLEENVYVRDRMHCEDELPALKTPGILIYDSDTPEEMDIIAEKLVCEYGVHMMAGCAGFAFFLSKRFHFNQKAGVLPKFSCPLLVLCGSVSDISRKQIAYEEKQGTFHATLKDSQKKRGYLKTAEGRRWLENLRREFTTRKMLLLDTEIPDFSGRRKEEETLRTDISELLGSIAGSLIGGCREAVVMVIGGDTLLGFLKEMECRQIVPVEEVETGTVLSKIIDGKKKMWLLSKSGGFGGEELVTRVIDKLGFERSGKR